MENEKKKESEQTTKYHAPWCIEIQDDAKPMFITDLLKYGCCMASLAVSLSCKSSKSGTLQKPESSCFSVHNNTVHWSRLLHACTGTMQATTSKSKYKLTKKERKKVSVIGLTTASSNLVVITQEFVEEV